MSDSVDSVMISSGETMVFRNNQPGMIELLIETAGGTKIVARLPPNGECEVLAGSDIVRTALDIHPYDPGAAVVR